MHGPYSEEMRLKLLEIDDTLGYLIEQLKSHHLFDKLNLIVTSDHGMNTISNNTVIFLDSYINTNLFDAYGSRACYSLFVKKSNYNDSKPILVQMPPFFSKKFLRI